MGTSQPLINGYVKSVHQLLHNQRYGLEYYQREFSWKKQQVEELMVDLSSAFDRQFEEGHTRKSVARYRPYFMGPIITSKRDGTTYLIDGQQRLTTLSLLMIQLLHRLDPTQDLRSTVQQCTYSAKFGEKSFTLDVEEREVCMHALVNDEEPDLVGVSASVENLWLRYQDLDDLLETVEDRLPMFVEWLLEMVLLVEIATTEAIMAYEIFETMNDRGLSLTPTDMLKGFLLANVADDKRIGYSDDFWRKRIKELNDSDQNADAGFFKSWLRSSAADSISRGRGATRGDWNLIGTEFHKWVRDNKERLELTEAVDFDEFINVRFDRMSRHYLQMVAAQYSLKPGLEHVRYNAVTGFSLQFTVGLAPVTPHDEDAVALAKIGMVAQYLDNLVAHRIVSFRNYGRSTMEYTMFNLCKEIRGLSLADLREVLNQKLEESDDSFGRALTFHLHQRNNSKVKYILARLTDFIERECQNESVFDQLVGTGRSDPFEIEHIWANKYERYVDDFESAHEFSEARNQLGGLLLLPKSFNASYGALPYEEKLRHYRGQNLILAKSLHPDTYERNPMFRRFVERTGLLLKPYSEGFDKKAMAERQELFRDLCEQVWPPTVGGPDD